MSMTDFQTSWIQLSFYGSYFCLALPAAIFIKKYTYKAGVLLGLGLFVSGSLLFYPASHTMQYGHFLASLFILAGGLSVLETSSNPYIIAMGPANTGTRRLNFAQSFNPIGSITGVLLSKIFILSNLNNAGLDERAKMGVDELQKIQSVELDAVMGPYVGIAFILVIIWFMISLTKMPKASDAGVSLNLFPTFKRLIKNSNYTWGVIAQFFYVGAQIGVWSYTIRYVMVELNLNEEQGSGYYLAALILFTLSRFIFTALMKFYPPKRLLAASAALAIMASIIVIFGSGLTAVYALVSISGFMSLMFPTIYGLAVEGLYEDTKIGGSGLIMAILGGAILTVIQGQLSDLTGSIKFAYIVPAVCFAVIFIYSLIGGRKTSEVVVAT